MVETAEVGRATIALRAFEPGDTVLRQGGTALGAPTVYTIQYDTGTHVEVDGPMRYLAHSCAPNARIDFDDRTTVRLVALAPIAPHERLSFDYCATEWDMAAKFDCHCGAPSCRATVGGFLHLAAVAPRAAAALAASQCTPFIRERAARLLGAGSSGGTGSGRR